MQPRTLIIFIHSGSYSFLYAGSYILLIIKGLYSFLSLRSHNLLFSRIPFLDRGSYILVFKAAQTSYIQRYIPLFDSYILESLMMSVADLSIEHDWQPYREITKQTDSFISNPARVEDLKLMGTFWEACGGLYFLL